MLLVLKCTDASSLVTMWREAPALVLKNIFCYLEASDLLAVSLTCQLWHQVAKEDSVWKHLVQRLWKIKGKYLNYWYAIFTRFSLKECVHCHEDLDI